MTGFLLLSDNCVFDVVGRPLWREDGSIFYYVQCTIAWVAPIVYKITPLHGPRRKHRTSIVSEACLPRRCTATVAAREDVSRAVAQKRSSITEPPLSNGSTCHNIFYANICTLCRRLLTNVETPKLGQLTVFSKAENNELVTCLVHWTTLIAYYFAFTNGMKDIFKSEFRMAGRHCFGVSWIAAKNMSQSRRSLRSGNHRRERQ
jgi:hypothetical protein